MRAGVCLSWGLLLAACKMDPTGAAAAEDKDHKPESSAAAPATEQAAPFVSHDERTAEREDKPRPTMQAQVVLDRLGFTPGVIDNREGLSTRNAILGFQEANGLATSGELDAATRKALEPWAHIPATRTVTIPADFAAGPFTAIPEEPRDKAKLAALSYETLDEKLAERFHTTVDVLRELNATIGPSMPSGVAKNGHSQSLFAAGQTIRVPNVGADRIVPGTVKDGGWERTLAMLGVGSEQPRAERIVVSKSKGTLKAYDASGKLVAMFTATMGSRHDPLPLGDWKIKGTAYNPPFHYNPDLFWDASSKDTKQLLPPGPNGPVGVAWIDLTKEHYGIHGTPEPQTIGRAESHGCVRLTNWDVARLAQMVRSGTAVLFEA
ncbi:MAG: murein L,D-transpeptidase [Alphaproteobacteria bacterium]|nr:MAG: murein L,D-transpeptidase [Alphaproteobacteria bacterium]